MTSHDPTGVPGPTGGQLGAWGPLGLLETPVAQAPGSATGTGYRGPGAKKQIDRTRPSPNRYLEARDHRAEILGLWTTSPSLRCLKQLH